MTVCVSKDDYDEDVIEDIKPWIPAFAGMTKNQFRDNTYLCGITVCYFYDNPNIG